MKVLRFNHTLRQTVSWGRLPQKLSVEVMVSGDFVLKVVRGDTAMGRNFHTSEIKK